MAIEVFNRYENKYILNEKTFYKLQNKLMEYMELDEYNKKCETYKICNIYYDTPDSNLIRTSLSKPKYKEKLRLRSYNVPNRESKVYMEIKKKYNGLVNKRRSAMILSEAIEFLKTGEITKVEPYMNKQVLNEIAYILDTHYLIPKLYLSYERRALFDIGKNDLRISFDQNIITRRYDLNLESGIYGDKLLEEGKWLMEIKVANSMPVWLTHLLSDYNIYPVSFSKYGTEYLRGLKNQNDKSTNINSVVSIQQVQNRILLPT